jgi:ABC-type dipeptide/oligopeptide/nickel transport system permease subunit
MLGKFWNFLKLFMHNRRGVLGVFLLVFFVLLASMSTILTPYDPIYDEFLSGDYSVPFWFEYLPGGQNNSKNYNMLPEAGFPTRDSLIKDWNFTTTSTSFAKASIDYDQSFGNKNPGSAAITYTREAGRYTGEVIEAHLKKQFNYPFNVPPRRFLCAIYVNSEGLENLQQVELALFIHRIEGTAQATYPLWNTLAEPSEAWQYPDPPIDSYAARANLTSDPAKIIFSKPGDYVYDLRIRFTDSPTKLGRVEATVYFDDIDTKFWGTIFGLLGTDHRGRDIFTQLAHGSRISLFIGLLSAVVSVTVGLMVGLVSGYLGKVVDEVMMRFTDMLLVLPSLPLLIVLIAVLGPSVFNLILLIGILGWMGFAREVRSQVLTLKERPFVEAAKAVGAGKFHVILVHVLPNVMSLVYVTLALAVPTAILEEAALSWLGLFDPRVVSWGRMLHDAQFEQGIDKWWWMVPPGISIALVALSFILLGYALDEALNPKLRQRR